MFSLVIPYHNREKFLPRTLKSIAACTLLPHRIILVDNASTDASAQICADFAAAHPELPIVLLSEPRKGASVARNAGLREVSTEWVYFFDSDDELSSGFFEAVAEAIKQNPAADLVACATLMVFADGREVRRAVQYSVSVVDQLLSGQLATQGMFVRTDLLRSIGGWNESLSTWDDWELGIRLLMRAPRTVWLRGRAWHRLYQHEDSQTGKDFSSTWMRICKALETAYREVLSDSTYLQALAVRSMLLAGILAKEKNQQAATHVRHIACGMARKEPVFFKKIILPVLYHYTRLGGRGGWILARKLFLR